MYYDNSPERSYGGDTAPDDYDPQYDKELEEYNELVLAIERIVPEVRRKVPGSEILEDSEIFQIIGQLVEDKSIPTSKIYNIMSCIGYSIPIENNTFFKVCEKERSSHGKST